MGQAARSDNRNLQAPNERATASGSFPLKNPVHEKLAREYAAGASMADAWRAIGRDPATGNQSRTFRRPDILARVEYLRGELNRMAGVSLAALQARLLRYADANVVSFFEADEKTRNLRQKDHRIDEMFTVFECNHRGTFDPEYIGFSIKGVRNLFDEMDVPLEGVYRLADLIGKIVRHRPGSAMSELLRIIYKDYSAHPIRGLGSVNGCSKSSVSENGDPIGGFEDHDLATVVLRRPAFAG